MVVLQVGAGFGFTFNGFRSVNLDLDGIAEFTPSGLLRLTNDTKQKAGHAFYPDPIPFKNSSEGSAFSFSTTFVFAIISEFPRLSGHGIAFVAAPQRGLPGALPSQYLGLFNGTNDGNDTNHVFAVELDTIQSTEFQDINDNHVGIDINGLTSANATPAGYYPDGGEILEARDPNLGGEFVAKEVELVLKLGLMCSHSDPQGRPTMRQVVHYLDGDMLIEDLSSSLSISSSGLRFAHREGFDDFAMSYPTSMDKAFSISSTVSGSLLSGGR
ncbi:hypothetical protein CRG98_040218 [Punica granatum]|uniref:Legume lectin domain-containing protein n=1 Tax=Punica granatum TaxID=22663 RepID=A0A2I0I5U9_PUNGR|nr:hypothetical protein CRG98_040218 [Punica granatum]